MSTPGLLVAAFGGPRNPDEVMPFLRKVTAGRDIPDARLAKVAQQYEVIGGVSPLNALTEELAQRVKLELESRGHDVEVAVGLRHSTPTLRAGLESLVTAGCERVVAVATSAYSSRSGCGQYRDELTVAWEEVCGRRDGIIKAEPFYAEDGFWRPFAEAAGAARRAGSVLLTSAHSLPVEMAEQCRYVAQLEATSALIAREAGFERWQLSYQSRSGRPDQPWLEPDVSDALRALAGAGEQHVVLAPIGFVHDHVEVLHDLDHVAIPLGASLGLQVDRIATPGRDVRFVRLVADLYQRLAGVTEDSRAICGAGCCASP